MNAIKTPSVSRKSILEFAASFGVLAAAGSVTTGAAPREGVVGAWSLVSFDVDEKGAPAKPRKRRAGASIQAARVTTRRAQPSRKRSRKAAAGAAAASAPPTESKEA